MTLIGEVNARWPGRGKASDGTIGDAEHATRSSDHNPWVVLAEEGIVRARDIDRDGIDAPWLAEHLRKLGATGDKRLTDGGYVIFNRRITAPDFRSWRAYQGTNPHVAHLHVSFSRLSAGFDSAGPWGIANPARSSPTPAPPPPMPQETDVLFVRSQLAPSGPPALAILAGPMFVGLGDSAERASADAAIKAGAVVLDVHPGTWREFDRRSHALCDRPTSVTVTNLPAA